jgi:hypothetical protein
MPAPWEPDDTKDAPLNELAKAFPVELEPHAETAWNMVRGRSGFEDADSWDDLAYVRHNWARAVAAAYPPVP